MKRCESCGAPLERNEECCSYCGQPTERGRAKQTRAKRKKTRAGKAAKAVLIISLVIFLLSAAVFAVTSAVLNMPKYRFARAQAAILAGGEKAEGGFSLAAVLKGEYGGDSEISTDGVIRADIPGLDLNSVIKGLRIEFGLNKHGSDAVLNATARFGSIPLMSAEAFTDADSVGVYSEKLSKKYYSAEKSVLRELLTGVSGTEISYTRTEDLAKAYASVLRRYGKILLKSVGNTDVTIESASRSYTGLSGDIGGCTVMTFTPNRQRMWALMKNLSSELGDDEELSNYVLSLLERYHRSDLAELIARSMEKSGMATDSGLMPAFGSASAFLKENAVQIAEIITRSDTTFTIVLTGDTPVAEYVSFGEVKLKYEKSADGVFFGFADPSMKLPNAELKLIKTDGVYSGTVSASVKDGRKRADALLTITRCDTEKKSAFGVPCGEYELTAHTAGYDLPEDIGGTLKVSAAADGGSEHTIVIRNADGLFGDDKLSDIDIRITTTDSASGASRTEMELTPVRTREELDGAVADLTGAITVIIKGLEWLF